MIYSAKKLLGKRIHSLDEDFGTCKDFLFDDQSFHIRYLVIDTGNWLPGRRVIITPQAIESLDQSDLRLGIPVKMSKDRIEKSPPLDSDKPVSRQAEERLHVYFGWQPYWFSGPSAPLYAGTSPVTPAPPPPEMPPEGATEEAGDPNLRSLKEVKGYKIRPADADSKGSFHDLLVDCSTWTVKYAVVNTCSWFIGAHKVIPIKSLENIDYNNSEIGCTLTAEQIKEAPDEPCDTLPVSFEKDLKLQSS